MLIHPIEAFSDNYVWLIEKGSDVIVVDPGEADGVLAYVKENHLNVTAILLTHKHDDHVGGVKEIKMKFPAAFVYGPSETASLNDHTLEEGDAFTLFDQTFEVIKTAGHTEEHISYVTDDAVFCGDALFSGGCGRVFTGDYAAQFDALQKLNHLNALTNVYAGHEYTQTNLRFARSIQPENEPIKKALEEVNQLREQNKPTLPSTIAKEKTINVFLQAATLDEFIALRKQRDSF